MNSMTGYGKAVAESGGRKITVEMKSVNHRFLDVSVKLPKLLIFLEDGIKKNLSENLSRGHVDVFITYENNRDDGVKLTVNEGIATEYLRIRQQLVEKYGVTDDYTLSAMLKTPDLVAVATAEEDTDALTALCTKAVSDAIVQLIKMRAFEGEKLQADLSAKVKGVEDIVARIAKLAPHTVENYRTKLKERITEALSGVELDEARLLNEVAFFSDKASTDEEITRLGSHCQHFAEMLKSDKPVGKNLDFLIQEFNREANTIGSKCNDIEVTNSVLELKNEIEKIREQIQNVE